MDFGILDLGLLGFIYKNPASVVRPPAGAFFSGKMTFLDFFDMYLVAKAIPRAHLPPVCRVFPCVMIE